MKKTRVLIVCQWPLGGIRTYLKYNYEFFPKDEFDVTLLASPSIESESVKEDMNAAGVAVEWAQPLLGRNVLFWRTLAALRRGRFDLIHSQGFISAFHVALVNWLFRRPHVLTIHGILEEKYFRGFLGRAKRRMLGVALRNVSVFHGVGEDILEHFADAFPDLRRDGTRWIAIPNGIKSERFVGELPDAGARLRQQHDLSPNTTVFGFFGRFMPQKGFNYIIDAMRLLQDRTAAQGELMVVAVGSGDYEKEYKENVQRSGLGDRFRFMSFTPDVHEIMKGCDAVLMPSVWEAYPILSSEVLCSGIPLIASDCIGLREATNDTPTITIPAHDAAALAEAMRTVIERPEVKDRFKAFQAEAARRFDVRNSAAELIRLFRDTVK